MNRRYIAFALVFPIVLPFVVLQWVLHFAMGKDKAFQMFSQLFSLIPGMLGNICRSVFYRMSLEHSELEVNIGFATIFSQTATKIHKDVYIGPQGNIGFSEIHAHCLLGSGVHILSGSSQHSFDDLDAPIQEQGGQYEKVTIGEDTWIGNNSVITADVGKKCVIGAGSVVTKPIPDYSIAVGNPAKVIRSRLKDE